VSRYGDDPVHLRRVQREYRRELARLVSEVAVRAASESGTGLLSSSSLGLTPPVRPRPRVPLQRTPSPED
jgi:hypothetical protein